MLIQVYVETFNPSFLSQSTTGTRAGKNSIAIVLPPILKSIVFLLITHACNIAKIYFIYQILQRAISKMQIIYAI